MKVLILFFLSFFLFSCSSKDEGSRLTIKYEDVPIFITDSVRKAQLLSDDRFSISLSQTDAVALEDAMNEIGKKIEVDVYIGDDLFGRLIFFPGEDFDTLNFPMSSEAKKILELNGINLR